MNAIDIKNQSVYQIYVRSFADANGDGIGDLQGIISKLDYIAALGVSYIWLTPIYPSPGADNGYDVANYTAINPLFGSMADFDELVAKAKAKGLNIMMDMVFNHTSTAHSWFQKALAGDKTYQDYYIFRPAKPDGSAPCNWLSKFGGSAWEFSPQIGAYYLHLFDKTQADLNWDNPAVREELYSAVNFWLNKGVKGFRFDVVNLISKPAQFIDDKEGDGRRFYTDGPHVHVYLKELHAKTFGRFDDVLTVGEMSSTDIENCILYSSPQEKELSMVFNFHHLKVDYKEGGKWTLAPFDFLALKRLFNSWQTRMRAGGGTNALFWSNHDQPRVVSRFGNDKRWHERSAKMLALACYLMDGVPYIYQGEELGAANAYFNDIGQYRDVESINFYQELVKSMPKMQALAILAAKSRDNGRTPMVWDKNKPFFGFSPKEPWLDFSALAAQAEAAGQSSSDSSILSFYKELLALRRSYKIFADGAYEIIDEGHAQIYAYRRILKGQEAVVICNFYPDPASFQLPGAANCRMLANNAGPCHALAQDKLELEPYQAFILFKG